MNLGIVLSLTGSLGVTQWFHTRSDTIFERTAKFFLAVLIYSFVCFCLKKIFAKLQDSFEKAGSDRRMLSVILRTIEYTLDTFVLSLAIVQWVFTESVKIAETLRILTLLDVRRWLHTNSPTVMDYVLKVILAFTFYIFISEVLNRLSRFIRNRLIDAQFSQRAIYILLKIINFSIQIFVIVISVIQLFIVEYNMIAAFIVLIVVTLITIYKLRNVDFRTIIESTGINDLELVSDTKVNKAVSILNSIFYKLLSVAIVLMLFFVASKGIDYLSGTGGREISQFADHPENLMAKELDTSFKDESLEDVKIPGLKADGLKVRSDGEIDIVYLDGKKVGVNTDSRNYMLFGVGINQTEIKVSDEMYYNYESCTQAIADLASGSANTYYYYNTKKNDCLALTINTNSNRVVNITYYTDYDRVAEILSISSE